MKFEEYPSSVEALKMIQDIISRLSNNSFILKGWTLTVVVAIMLLGNNSTQIIKCLSTIPVVLFWCLDSYYLYLEKLFRIKHEELIFRPGARFVSIFNFNTKKMRETSKPKLYFTSLFSIIELGFYGAIIMLVFLTIVFS